MMLANFFKKEGRQDTKTFFAKMLWTAIFVLALFSYTKERFAIGLDLQEDKCIPGKGVFLIDRHSPEPIKDKLFSFRTRGVPNFPDDTLFTKYIAGVPGDHVQVTENSVIINGEVKSEGALLLAPILKKEPKEFVKDYVLKANEYFFMGLTLTSLDSRYWGPVRKGQIEGRSYAIW